MSIAYNTYRLKNRLKFLLNKKSESLSQKILNLNSYSERISKNGNVFIIHEIGLQLKEHSLNIIIDVFEHFVKIFKKGKCTVKEEVEEGFILIVNDSRFFITSSEDIFIIREVFFRTIYNFTDPVTEYVFIDVGMNVGITSVFCSLKENISKIYAYEPFTPTFQQGERNFQLNPVADKKVRRFNYGLFSTDKSLLVEYTTKQRGRVGIYGTDKIREVVSTQYEEEIVLKDCFFEIKKIREENSEKKLILKVDTEGSEYEIFNRLDETKLLEDIAVILIEWHEDGPEQIVGKLLKAGFRIFSFDEQEGNTGMIYGVK